MNRYYLGIDIGTTGIKGILVRPDGVPFASARKEQHQFFPKPGWSEQDPQELLDICLAIVEELLSKQDLSAGQLIAIGLDHQGETCLIWDRETGIPVYPAIVWQDRRMAAASEAFTRQWGAKIQHLTGLHSDSYYSAWKLRWILDHIPDGQARAEKGELLAGTLNTWIIWNLTGRRAFVTDEGSTNCMMLADPRSTGWNPWLLEQMELPRCMLPRILPSSAELGVTDPEIFFGAAVPITASLPDGAAGIVASGALGPGDLTVSYGTGNFLHMVTGDRYIPPDEGLTAYCGFNLPDKRFYFLNGICYTAGAAIKWLQKVGLSDSISELEALVGSVEDTCGVYFVPALNGLATPFWNQNARAAFLGITAACGRAHLVRAVVESIALQVAQCVDIMRSVSGMELVCMNAVGGMTANRALMQLQADLCGIPVYLPRQVEPAYGAACLAAQRQKDIPLDELQSLNSPVQKFTPRLSDTQRRERIARWRHAVERIQDLDPD